MIPADVKVQTFKGTVWRAQRVHAVHSSCPFFPRIKKKSPEVAWSLWTRRPTARCPAFPHRGQTRVLVAIVSREKTSPFPRSLEQHLFRGFCSVTDAAERVPSSFNERAMSYQSCPQSAKTCTLSCLFVYLYKATSFSHKPDTSAFLLGGCLLFQSNAITGGCQRKTLFKTFLLWLYTVIILDIFTSSVSGAGHVVTP